ncbi:MAG: hypothetical protein ACTSX7_18670 [Alphaproteobacteria bacterium]
MIYGREYSFRIDAYTPETLPMERLAQYMTDLAKMLGEPASVHFLRLERGSAVLVQKIDEEAEPMIRHRVRAARSGKGPAEAVEAYRRLNRKLLDDNAVGTLTDAQGTNIVDFPGRELAEPVTFGRFSQLGSLDGVVIRIGGVRDNVPVLLEASDGKITFCQAPRDLAKLMAQHLFGVEIRVHGNGRWNRDKTGEWELKSFTAASFDVLGDEPLSAVVARLREVEGNEWREVNDPWAELEWDRNGPRELH